MQEIRETETEQLNPFISIWTKTRETVRYALEYKREKYFYFIILIAGILALLPSVFDTTLGFEIPIIVAILLALILGPILGFISTMIGAGIYLLVGKLFKGKATFNEMWKTIALTQLVSIWMAPLLLIGAFFTKGSYFSDPFATTVSPTATAVDAIIGIFLLVLGIWSIIISSKAIGEAHQFSSWKGFFTMLIPGVIVFIIAVVIIVTLSFAMFGTF
ncbi:YIP1 family protein [Paenisporosarcina cavernae]|nr:YIP1 family protein [Paenisporosarcina cavernae]